MPTRISPLAVVDPLAELGDAVEIGPFCLIGPDVCIGDGTRLENNVTVVGQTRIGRRNHIHAGAVIGGEPQDVSYRGGQSRVEIGDFNVIREGVTINRATDKEDGITSLGSNCYLMACSHLAHDCRVGDRVVLANGALLGGHVHVQDDASLSGNVAVHHYTTIGSFSFVAGLSRVIQDVPPFMLVEGFPGRPRCINLVALKRNGFPAAAISALGEAYRLLYRAKVGLEHAREILRNDERLVPEVLQLLGFVEKQQEGRFGRGREKRRAA
jgi:UDP-N-acetylglucosamine acyltransferase